MRMNKSQMEQWEGTMADVKQQMNDPATPGLEPELPDYSGPRWVGWVKEVALILMVAACVAIVVYSCRVEG